MAHLACPRQQNVSIADAGRTDANQGKHGGLGHSRPERQMEKMFFRLPATHLTHTCAWPTSNRTRITRIQIWVSWQGHCQGHALHTANFPKLALQFAPRAKLRRRSCHELVQMGLTLPSTKQHMQEGTRLEPRKAQQCCLLPRLSIRPNKETKPQHSSALCSPKSPA